MAGEQTASPVNEPAARAIRLLGGPVRAADRLGVERYQTVQSWVRNRVPAEYCPLIERATEGAVRCEELRPDIAWEVLVERPTPPLTAKQPEV